MTIQESFGGINPGDITDEYLDTLSPEEAGLIANQFDASIRNSGILNTIALKDRPNWPPAVQPVLAALARLRARANG